MQFSPRLKSTENFGSSLAQSEYFWVLIGHAHLWSMRHKRVDVRFNQNITPAAKSAHHLRFTTCQTNTEKVE